MNLDLDHSAVRQNFSKAAPEYDKWAKHQKLIAARLCALLPDDFCPHEILELGCGTGILTNLLHTRYQSAAITAIDFAPGMIEHCRNRWPDRETAHFIVSQAESFLPSQTYSLIASSCSFQWFTDKSSALHNAALLLGPEGRVALSVPVTGTLVELSECYRAVTGKPMPGIDLWNETHYLDHCRKAGLTPETIHIENVRVAYDNALTVLQTFKGIGATLSRQQGFQPLSVPQTRRFLKHYHQEFTGIDGLVTLTYRVLYLILEGAKG